MPKLLTRVVVLLLVPCLMTDPMLAATLTQPRMFDEFSLSQKVFTAQAIVPSSFISRQTDPGECPKIVERTAGEAQAVRYSRRAFFNRAAGIAAAAAAASFV